MRIQTKDLALHLKRPLSPLYFVFGDDALQLKETIDAIRLTALAQGYTERVIFEIGSSARGQSTTEWDKLSNALDSPSLFSEKRLIECRLGEGKIGKTGADALNKLLSRSPNNETLLLFTAEKIEKQTQSSNWFTTLERKAQTIWAHTLSKEEMLGWLKHRTSSLGFQLSEESIHAFFESTEGNRLSAAQVLDKLSLLHPNASTNTPVVISLEDIQKILEFDARFSLFDLVDAALSGSTSRTIRIFSSLKNEGTDPILLLWALTREVRAIIPLARQIKAGLSEKAVFSQHGVWKRRETLISQCIQRCSLSKLHQMLLQAKNIDDILKGRLKGQGWSELRFLYLALASKQNG